MDKEIEGYLRHLQFEQNASPNTIRSYADAIRRAAKFFRMALDNQGARPQQLTPSLIGEYVTWLAKSDYSVATIHRNLGAVRSWCRWMYLQGILSSNPVIGVYGPRREKKIGLFLKIEEIARFLEAIPSNAPRGIRDRAIFWMFATTGVRRSELVDMNIDDLDFAQSQAKVRGKGRKERLVPLASPTIAALKSWLQIRAILTKSDPDSQAALFVNLHTYQSNEYGNRINKEMVKRWMKAYLIVAGLDRRFGLHVLRRSYATALMECGGDIARIQLLMGHSSPRTTCLYTNTSTVQLREAHQFHPRAREE